MCKVDLAWSRLSCTLLVKPKEKPFPGSLGRHWALMKLRVSELTLRRNEPSNSFGVVSGSVPERREDYMYYLIVQTGGGGEKAQPNINKTSQCRRESVLSFSDYKKREQ